MNLFRKAFFCCAWNCDSSLKVKEKLNFLWSRKAIHLFVQSKTNYTKSADEKNSSRVVNYSLTETPPSWLRRHTCVQRIYSLLASGLKHQRYRVSQTLKTRGGVLLICDGGGLPKNIFSSCGFSRIFWRASRRETGWRNSRWVLKNALKAETWSKQYWVHAGWCCWFTLSSTKPVIV